MERKREKKKEEKREKRERMEKGWNCLFVSLILLSK